MANPNAPAGLTPVQYLDGSPWDNKTRQYWIPQSDTNRYQVGDPVASINATDGNGVPGITLGVAGSPIRGVISSVQPNPLLLEVAAGVPATKYSDYYVQVVDDPNVIFAVQESSTDTSGTPLNDTDVFTTFNFLVQNPPSISQVSATVLDNTTAGTGANLLTLGLRQPPGNGFGPYAQWLVVIAAHELRIFNEAGSHVWTGNQSVIPVALTEVAGHFAVNAKLSNNFTAILSANGTLDNPTNLTDGMILNFVIKQDGTGGWTLAFGTKYAFPGGTTPTVSAAANAIDFMSCYYDAGSGDLLCNYVNGMAP